MKKIILSIFIIGLSLLGFAQDRFLIDEDFDTFKPTGWSTLETPGVTTWSKSAYPKVVNSVDHQVGKLISPSISLTMGVNYQINFNHYQEWTGAFNGDLTLVVSYDNGVTWDPASANADELWAMPSGVNKRWASSVTASFSPVATGNAKFAFIVDGVNGDFDVVAIDDFILVDLSGPTNYKTYLFENGISAATWTIDNTGSVATTTWVDEALAKVGQSIPAAAQQESLISPKIATPVVGFGALDGSITYYSLVNAAGSGVRISVATQSNWAAPQLLDDTHRSGTSTNDVNTIPFTEADLNSACGYVPGDSLQFTFEFLCNTGDANYFLENFMLEMQFDEALASGADADLTLTGDTTAVYPLNSRYNGDFKEGFWEVAPLGWTNTKVSKANWRRETPAGSGYSQDAPATNHDYYAYIDTVGAKKAAMNETLASVSIPITYPPTTANYKLAFEWMNETNRNAGLNTDPLLGPDADYDFADVIVQIRTNAGAWTTIWQEDNITLLNATSDTDGGNDYYYGWTGYQDYLDNPGRWYKAILDISQYLTAATTSVEVRVNYAGSGVNGGAFAIDNLYITQAAMVEFELEAMQSQSVAATYNIDYYNIPISQVVNPVALSAKIRNNGVTTFPNAPLTATVKVDDGTNPPVTTVYGYKNVTSAAWTTRPSTVLFTIDTKAVEFASGLTLTAGNTYTYDYSASLHGNPYSDNKSFKVGTDLYTKHDGSYDGDVELSDGTSGAIGSLFEFKVNDVVDYVNFYVRSATANSEVYMSIIKLTSATATSGTTVYTSPRKVIGSGVAEVLFDDPKNISLAAGFYAIMLHQTDLNPIVLEYNDLFEGQVLRGKASALYTASNEKFNLKMDVGIIPNVAPEIVTEFPNDRLVVKASTGVKDSVLFEIIATDENGDAITFPTDSITTNPSWLASWMKYKTSKGDTLIIYGKPQASDLGKTEVRVVAKDSKNGSSAYTFTIEVVSELAIFTPDYDANFIQFTQKDDVNGASSGSPTSWDRSGVSNADITGNSSYEQNEWLISPPISLPTSTTKTLTYKVVFDWQVASFDHFCLGIPGVLGTSDGMGGYNNADVALMVSRDNGKTWSAPIWKEDDSELVSSSTKGIQGGSLFTYDSWTTYTSKISVDSYKGDTVVFAFQYKGKNADANNYFEISSFEVVGNNDVDVSTFVRSEYLTIPAQQADTSGLVFEYYLVNAGQSIPAGSTYDIQLPEIGYFERISLSASDFAANDTIMKTKTFDIKVGEYQDYTFKVTLNVADNVNANVNAMQSHEETLTISNQTYSRSSFDGSVVSTHKTIESIDIDNGLGTIFEVNTKDYLEKIDVGFWGNTKYPFIVQVLKLDSIDAVKGEPIATIREDVSHNPLKSVKKGTVSVIVKDDENIGKNILLEPGIYAVMFYQVNENEPLSITRFGNNYDKLAFVRGNHQGLYNEPKDHSMLDVALQMELNVAPEFTTSSPNSLLNEEIYLGESFTRNVIARDANIWGDITIEAVNIPNWLTLTDNGNGLATIEGSLADAHVGTYDIVLKASDGYLESGASTSTFTLTVLPNPVPEFTSAPPSVAYVNAPFSYKAIASDMLGDVVTITAPVIPSWLTVSAANDTVTLSGTPLAANEGSNVVKLTATDVYGNVSHQTFNVFVYANDVPEFVSMPVTESSVGLAYSYYVVAMDANGNSGLTISANAGLASWLTFTDLGSGKATLVGTPVAAGADTVTLTVTDPAGASAVQKFAIVRSTNQAPVFTSTAITAATEDVLYRYEVAATDADGDMLYFNTEVIPNWLTFTVTGNGKAVLQGIPLQNSAADTSVSLLVGDGNNTTLQNFSIKLTMVNDAPAIISTAVKTAVVGEVYAYVVEAYDEEGASLMFSANLPAWLTISEDNGIATISGIPMDENVGDAAVSIAVNDGNSSAEQVFTLSVSGATSINSSALSAVQMYPNPTSGSFSLKNAEGANVYVINNAGQIVKQISKASKVQVIDISELNAGTYFVKIVSESNVLTKSLNLIK